MTQRAAVSLFLSFLVSSAYLSAQGIDPVQARTAFAEARQVSDKDGGRLWGLPLYGPMIFVDPATQQAVANEADQTGVLHAQDGVWVGVLPPEVVPANTAIHWGGKYWTLIMWPLPEHSQPRRRLMAHELYHRLQDDLHLPANGPQNPQLDTLEGRYWLQLEWRALAAALLSRGIDQAQGIRDALSFRAQRHRLFPGSGETERQLEMNEGLAESTGYEVFAPDVASARWRLEADLVSPSAKTFVRSFAYTSGPAYALLLDERDPAWRKKLSAQSDLAKLLGAVAGAGESTLPDAEKRAPVYGGAGLHIVEAERAAENEAQQAHYRQLLVDGPTLRLSDAGKFNFSFDPNQVVPLGAEGIVNPWMEVTDVWGKLTVQQGALLRPDMKSVTVSAPAAASGTHITGAGWVLDLNPGWKVSAGNAPGRLVLSRQ